MATYYQESSELQADVLQTLYLMNPNNCVGLSDNQHQSSPMNRFFFNENNSAAAPTVLAVSHAPLPQAGQFAGIPISHEYPSHSSALDKEEEIHGSCHNTIVFPRFGHHSLWGASVDQSTAGNQPEMYQQTSKVSSLSLSPHQERFIDDKLVHGYQDFSGQSSNGMMVSPKKSTSYSSMISAVPNGINNGQSVIMGSKYLKAAKQLLDEVVSVENCIENDRPKGSKDKVKKSKESMALNVKASSTGGENAGKGGGVELTIPQRQELQMKKAKLLCMLDEVEQRYRQYRHQVQIVVESLEQVAGIASAKSYTNLALNTILKQFKCLKDAISAQIKELKKTLGEEEGLKDGSRVLKIFDHQVRQEKTLQQLGMMPNNAWRPHRGLPERAVSVLRAWLFENFLHPYPKDSDKQMLAKQTGLTRSQVSNWFINARVRLWKPMVEEMYLEEIKNHEEDQDQAKYDENCTIKNEPERELGSKQDKNTEKTDHGSSLQSKPQNLQVPSPTEISASTVITTSPTTTQPGFAQLITSLNMENIPENNPKKPRNRLDTQSNSPNSTNSKLSDEMEMKESRKGFMNKKFCSDEQNYFNSARFGYEIEELGLRFNNTGQMPTGQIFNRNNNNNVFLTLALPPSQNSPLSAARNDHQNFLSNPNFEFGTRIESGVSHSSRVNGLHNSNIGYDQILDFQNRKTFPSQLLPDFVA